MIFSLMNFSLEGAAPSFDTHLSPGVPLVLSGTRKLYNSPYSSRWAGRHLDFASLLSLHFAGTDQLKMTVLFP